MKITVLRLCSLFALCLGLAVCKPCLLTAQPLDLDLEQRIAQDKPFVEETESEINSEKSETRKAAVPFKESREVKYVAGTDKKWFTKDDDVYEYYLLSYDNKGRLARKSGYLEGNDDVLMTKDDVLHDYLVYEYGPDGKISREILYDGKGGLQYTGIYQYDDSGHKISMKRYDPENKEIGSANFFYGHAGLLVRDVEYKGSEIEKYHRFEYDHNHKAGRVTEYLGSEGGKGKDDKWFTDDDVVTSAKRCYFNDDGTKDKERKFIKPGPDKKWFTKDDELQYYTVFYYKKK